jgi:SAM-dependent methyltransferase
MSPTMLDDVYGLGAKYYDPAYDAKKDLVDGQFYLELANIYGGPVLEFGCGTGRITLPMARQGVDITGLDRSHPMLEVLRSKLAKEPPDVARRVRVVEGDFLTHDLGRKFELVTIPFRPMQHMYTAADQVSALQNAAKHLTDGGILAFDVFYPRFDRVFSGVGEEYLEMEWPANDGTDKVVQRYFVKDGVDPVNLNFTGRFIFRLCEGDQVLEKEEHCLKMSVYTYPHLKALFYAAGAWVKRCVNDSGGDLLPLRDG